MTGLVMAPEEIASIVTAFALVMGGVWAGVQFRAARRSSRAEWIVSLHRNFYLDPPLASDRRSVEDSYDERIKPQVQIWLARANASDEPSFREADAEKSLDSVLNFLELISYLEQRGELTNRDVTALFDYWIRWVGGTERPELRLYLEVFGYEGVCRLVNEARASSGSRRHVGSGPLESPLAVAVYGSLVPGSSYWANFVQFACDNGVEDVEERVRVEGAGWIDGSLHDLGLYPGVTAGGGRTTVTILALPDAALLQVMDAYEASAPSSGQGPMYEREFWRVHLPDGSQGAWVYVYRGPIPADSHVVSGDWEAHVASRPA